MIKEILTGMVPALKKVTMGSGLNLKPLIFILTSTGTGGGVATLKMEVTKDTTLILGGAAKFYDDALGTLGEGIARTVTAGALRTFYLKCPSGTANLLVSDTVHWVKWGTSTASDDGYASATNAPSIAGDISNLTSLIEINIRGLNTLNGNVTNLINLTYLYIGGSNTISGSVAGLTKLTYITVTGNNTLSGSVAGLINLTYMIVTGINTLSGSVAGLKKLNFISVPGFNTLSGSITGLTELTLLSVVGYNTLSGSVAGLTKLTYMNVIGSNTLSGDIGGSGTAAMVNGITEIHLGTTSQMADYTSGATWSLTASSDINPAAGYGYSATEIDNMIIDMAASLGVVTEKTITLKGSSAARTSGSDAAVATLLGKGWTVVTN